MKGSMVPQFKKGDHVVYKTNTGVPKVHPLILTEMGTVVKLHRSCRGGVAEIRPDGGGHKVSRRLIHVEKGA